LSLSSQLPQTILQSSKITASQSQLCKLERRIERKERKIEKEPKKGKERVEKIKAPRAPPISSPRSDDDIHNHSSNQNPAAWQLAGKGEPHLPLSSELSERLAL
jgi:hypothetical protein